jgi:hypothetical protein
VSNLDLFNLYTARILARLYEEFPIARAIIEEDVVNPPQHRTGPIPDTEEQRRKREVAHHTRVWLTDTGYLLERPGNTYRWVLAPKALEILNAPLTALLPKERDGTKTVGTKLADVTKEVATEGTKKAVAEIVGQVIGAAVKSFTGP